jgi:excisionase family DNA binding protein
MEPLLEQLLEEGLAALRQCIAAAAIEAIDAALTTRAGIWPECRACCERRADEPVDQDEREPMVTRDQLAEELGVDLATIDRYRDSRELESYKFGRNVRFKRSDINDFVERHREPGGPNSEPGA